MLKEGKKKLFCKEKYCSTQIFLSNSIRSKKHKKTWPHGQPKFETITPAVAISGAEVDGKDFSNYDLLCGICRGDGGESFYGDDFSNGGLCWPTSIREGGGWDVYKSIWSENKLNRMNDIRKRIG
jgi:hypothetical protein